MIKGKDLSVTVAAIGLFYTEIGGIKCIELDIVAECSFKFGVI